MNSKNVKSFDKENAEKMLSKLFSTIGLKDESFKDDLMMDEVAASLTDLSLEVDSLETFDRVLAVFDCNGNIIVEYCVYRFLTKALLKANGGNESLNHLF